LLCLSNYYAPLTPCLELTPAEEAAARAKEAEEQAALPYKWTQTIADLDISFSVPGNFKGKDLVIDIKKLYLVAGVKGQEPIIKVCTCFISNHRLIYYSFGAKYVLLISFADYDTLL
jgi:hypothetical protein